MASKGDLKREERLALTRLRFMELRKGLKNLIAEDLPNLSKLDKLIESSVNSVGDRNFVAKKLTEIKKIARQPKAVLTFLLDKLPKDSSMVRARNRCSLYGCSRAVNTFFGLCRHHMRKLFNEGLVPGVQKASW